jgi:hypothetical protein
MRPPQADYNIKASTNLSPFSNFAAGGASIGAVP